MQRFFSKVRLQLLGQGNLRRALTYAIGEILLIVIGIMLALQLSNLNQAKANKAKETNYLIALMTDLEYSKKALDRILKKSARVKVKAEDVARLSKKNPEPIDESLFDSLLFSTLGYTIFMPIEGTINELIYSGDLELIENPEIRSKIASWEADLRYIRELEGDAKVFLNQIYVPYLLDNVDMLAAEEGFEVIRDKKNAEILKDFRFRNLVSDMANQLDWLNALYTEKNMELDTLISLIQWELDK